MVKLIDGSLPIIHVVAVFFFAFTVTKIEIFNKPHFDLFISIHRLQRNNTKMMLVTSNRRIRFSVLIFIGIAMCQFCTADVFTSMSEMEELMDSHAVLINNLEAYVAAHENKLINLKR